MLHPDMCDPILLKFATENVLSNFLADEKLLLILVAHMLLHSKFCPFEKNSILLLYRKLSCKGYNARSSLTSVRGDVLHTQL